MTNISAARIGAVIRKEFTEFRRSRFIMVTMVIIPLIFGASPTAVILTLNPGGPSASTDKGSASCSCTCW